jgi:hypothetical protein
MSVRFLDRLEVKRDPDGTLLGLAVMLAHEWVVDRLQSRRVVFRC